MHIQLLSRLQIFDKEAIKKAGLKRMIQHSWYLSPKLTLTLFSTQLTNDEKV